MILLQVNCIKMAPPLVEELKLLENDGVETFDAFLQVTVLVVAPVICIISDNPRALEKKTHSNSNFYEASAIVSSAEYMLIYACSEDKLPGSQLNEVEVASHVTEKVFVATPIPIEYYL